MPHLDGETIFYAYTPEDKRPATMVTKHDDRIALINEIIGAKYIVIATQMWNWGPPSVLKAYVDQLVLPGTLDPYTQKHLAGKSFTILIASGGSYGHNSERDFLTGYLSFIGTQLGSEDVKAIRTEYTLAGVQPGLEHLIPKKEESFAIASAAAIERANAL